jgi:plastocyanin
MSSFAPIVDRIRIIPRPADFLSRNSGNSGEVFFNSETNSLRVYSGKEVGGFEIARSDFDNILPTAQLDIQSQKNRIRFHWDTLSDLETEVDPVTYHGMIAHVHSEGRLYFAHAAEWVPVANLAEASLIPYEADTADELQWVEGTWDFGNNIIKYANAIQLEVDLANYDAGVYHGMTMHVHETGALYYAHAGAWRKLLTDTAHSDVESAGYNDPLGAAAYSNAYSDLEGTPQSILDFNIDDGTSGQVLSTDGAGNFTFVDQTGGSGGTTTFDLVETDDGSYDAANTTTLSVVGGENISTESVTDSNQITVNLNSFSIDFLSDVDTTTSAPQTGEVLKWDGAKWAPGTDIAEGGTGLDADTLDGFDSSYFLDYNNFTNTPDVLTLSDISVGNELSPAGNGAVTYDNTVGVFRFTPPTAEGIGALTSVAFSDLTSTPTTLSGYGITDAVSDSEAFSGDYNDLINTPSIPQSLLDLNISDGTDGQVLTTDGSGNFSFATVTTDGTGGDPDQNLFATIVGDSGTTTADSVTDTLTIAGGTGITTSISGDTLTINQQSSAASFASLTETNAAELTVDKIYEPALLMFRVNNVGASSYTFAPHYSGENPTIYALSGATVAFDLDEIGGHPFAIQDSEGNNLTDGLVHVDASGNVSTGSNAQGKDSGTLYWRILETIFGTYRYQCLNHASMVGPINIKRLSVI